MRGQNGGNCAKFCHLRSAEFGDPFALIHPNNCEIWNGAPCLSSTCYFHAAVRSSWTAVLLPLSTGRGSSTCPRSKAWALNQTGLRVFFFSTRHFRATGNLPHLQDFLLCNCLQSGQPSVPLTICYARPASAGCCKNCGRRGNRKETSPPAMKSNLRKAKDNDVICWFRWLFTLITDDSSNPWNCSATVLGQIYFGVNLIWCPTYRKRPDCASLLPQNHW